MPKETAKMRGPKSGGAKPQIAAGEEVKALKNGDVRRKPDGKRRQQDVPGDHPAPLHAREQNRIEFHAVNSNRLTPSHIMRAM
jgi:hypothetical protein